MPEPCCYQIDCDHGGIIRPGEPSLADGTGTVHAHDACHDRRLGIVQRIREAAASAPEVIESGGLPPEVHELLRRTEATLVRGRVSPDGTWRIPWGPHLACDRTPSGDRPDLS